MGTNLGMGLDDSETAGSVRLFSVGPEEVVFLLRVVDLLRS